MPDLMQLLLNTGNLVPSLITTLRVLAGVMSIWLVGSGIFELYAVSNDNNQRLLSGRKEFTWAGGLGSLLIGGLMMGFTTLDVIAPLTNGLTGGYVTNQLMMYQVDAAASLTEKGKAALSVIFMILQVVGFIAFLKAFWMFNNRFNNGPSNQISMGLAFGYLIGGFLCWNAKWVIDVAGNEFGFNILGLFF